VTGDEDVGAADGVSQGMRVLLVEDSPADAKLVEIALQDVRAVEVRLHWSRNMADAVSHLRAEAVDVVLLDLSLPDTHGLGSVAAIKSVRPALPIVILTGDSNPVRGEQTVAMGAQDYMFKGDLRGDTLERSIKYSLLRASNDRLQREQQRQSARREQVEVVERLSGAIAHELNNSLTIVRSAAELIGLPELEAAEREEFERAVVDGVERASAIADQLFALGGGRPFRTTRTDLGSVVRTLVPLLGRVLGPRAKLEIGDVDAKVVETSQGTVERAVKLLVLAFVDQLDEARGRLGGREASVRPEPTLTLSVVGREDGFDLSIHTDVALDAKHVQAVADDLTLRAVARSARGRLHCERVDEHRGGGTQVLVHFVDRFSEAKAQPNAAVARRATSAPMNTVANLAGERVLVVEDEAGVRRAVARLVRSLGLDVATAASGGEALELMASETTQGRSFGALIVDIRMPGIGGVELVQRIIDAFGPIPVVFVSGFNDDLSEAAALPVRWELVPKPFGRSELSSALMRVAQTDG